MRTWAQPASRTLLLGALVAISSLGLVRGGQAVEDKIKLIIKADAGATARYQSSDKIVLDIAGQKLTIDSTDVIAVKFKSIGKDGTVVLEKKTESSKTSFNGEAMPPDEAATKITRTETLLSDGRLSTYESDDANPDTENKDLNQRLFSATSAVFSPNPVGVGESWTIDLAENTKYGIHPAKSTFTLLGLEEVGGVKCAKIKQVFAENGSGQVLSSTCTHWVEITSGDTVKSESKLTNIPFKNGAESALGTGEGTESRISGSPLTQTDAQKEADKQKADKAKEEESSIDIKVKDFEKIPGVFNLYKKAKDGRTTLYLELPEAMLNQNLMLQATFSTGSGDGRAVAGDPISDQIFQFRKMPNDKVFLVVPNFQFRSKGDQPIQRAIDRSYPETYLEAFTVEATQKSRKSILLDVSNFFLSDISGVSLAFSGRGGLLGGGQGGVGLDREKTFISSLKNFPKNLVVQTTYSLLGGRGVGPVGTLADARGLVVKVDYNLFRLPTNNGYKPRYYDSRVGYFTADYVDYSSDKKEDLTKQMIVRWNLIKKDPAAAVSEPVEPIVFWLDNAIPTEYRQPVKDGLLNWNKALLAAGFKDAIVVNQMPDNADFDHADMSHNVVRWVVSPDNAYAVALFRPNPLTGQILNANITVDAGMTKFVNAEYGFFVDPAKFLAMFDRDQAPTVGNNSAAACSYASEAMPNAAMGYLAVTMLAGQVPGLNSKMYVDQFLRETVCHEMGHIMGLRHNFAASGELSLEQLTSAEITQREGNAASVMDYLPFNLGALKGTGATFFSQTVGAYDIWAIQYGYTPTNAKTSEGELSFLRNWASKTNEPGHTYLSDEYADNVDPHVTRFDSSSDPLGYWQKSMEVSRYLLFKLGDFSPRDGESFYGFTRNFDVLLGTYSRAASQASKFVGGVRKNPNFKGDANQVMPFRPVSTEEQKRALKMLNTYFFAENSFAFPKKYYQMFTGNPTGAGLEGFLAGFNDYPVQDRFASLQKSALRSLFSSGTLRRLVNQEFTATDPSSVLRIVDLFHSTTDTVWSEVGSGREIDPLRRQLQRAHVDLMVGIMLGRQTAPDEAKSMAYGELAKLKGKLTSAAAKAKGVYTPTHLREVLARVTRALEARESVGSSGSSSSSLLDLLLGGETPKKPGG